MRRDKGYYDMWFILRVKGQASVRVERYMNEREDFEFVFALAQG